MPTDIEAALNGLIYKSVKPNIVDMINISLYDGQGGNCLDVSLLGTGSTRIGCLMTSVSFKVTVLDFQSLGESNLPSLTSGINSLGFKIKLIAGCIALVLLLGMFRCCYLRRLHQLKIKYVLQYVLPEIFIFL